MRPDSLQDVTRCEWCGRETKLDPHHVAQGTSRSVSDGMPELTLMICRPCHDTLHECSKHARAIGLALIYLAGRGFNLAKFHEVTERKMPYEEDVRRWIYRLQKPRAKKPDAPVAGKVG